MPWCDTDAMAAHLIEISAAVDPGAHAVLIVDQAGWHLTPKLAIPDNGADGKRYLSNKLSADFIMFSFSGLSQTGPAGCQFRVLPDHRSGFCARAVA